jgi:hypothetical protein
MDEFDQLANWVKIQHLCWIFRRSDAGRPAKQLCQLAQWAKNKHTFRTKVLENNDQLCYYLNIKVI